MNTTAMARGVLLIVLACLVLGGCTAPATVTASPTVVPTPTPTFAPTPAQTPTSAPTATASPAPTVASTPIATPTVQATPSATVPASATPSGSPTSDVVTAIALLATYLEDINAGDYQGAYALLSPRSQQGYGTVAQFTSERTAFHQSTGNTYSLTPNPPNTLSLNDWLPVADEPNLDRAHAVIIEVDYPKLAGNNAGFEIFVVGPINGNWFLWNVR